MTNEDKDAPVEPGGQQPEDSEPASAAPPAPAEPPEKPQPPPPAQAGPTDKPAARPAADATEKSPAAVTDRVDTEKAAAPPKAPPKAAPAAGHKPAPPPRKGPTVTADITDDPFIDRLKEQFGDAITEAVATLGQQIVRVRRERYFDLCRALRDDEEFPFDMCSDLTAVHWPERKGEEFDVVAQLYSVARNRRLRVKTSVADGEACPSVTPLWAGANWMEREVYDMFGVRFEGHPDLRRILLPEDWPGHPLRKEYPVEYRDNEWTDKHLEYREVDYDTSLIDVKYAERR